VFRVLTVIPSSSTVTVAFWSGLRAGASLGATVTAVVLAALVVKIGAAVTISIPYVRGILCIARKQRPVRTRGA